MSKARNPSVIKFCFANKSGSIYFSSSGAVMFRLSTCLIFACLTCALSSNGDAQTGVFDDVILKDTIPQLIFRPENDPADDWCIEVFGVSPNRTLNVDGPLGNFNIIEVHEDANSESFMIDGDCVTINPTLRIVDNIGFSHVPTLEFDNGTSRWAFKVGINSFCLDRPGFNTNIIDVHDDARRHSFVIDSVGVGIGTFSPNAGLHVFSGDFGPFTNAKVTIENAESQVATREQLRLINNGPARLALNDSNLGVTWSLITTSDDQFQIRKNGSGTANMAIRANGTFAFGFAGASNFAIYPHGNAFLKGALTQGSDRNAKKNIRPVDPQEVLDKVIALPVSYWTYKKEPDNIRHVGPMAQDFYNSFEIGVSDTGISTLDTSGVALAAIQGMHQQMEAKDKRIQQLSDNLQEQTELVAELIERLERVEAIVTPR